MRLAYDIVDVFTDRPFAGNQLAVVHGAADLSTAQCQAIAQEFNYSETTFPAPRGDHDYAVRIFTPGSEIPFAGHPTLGTAWVLRSRGELAEGDATQHCGAGEIGVRFSGERAVELSAVPRDAVAPSIDSRSTIETHVSFSAAASSGSSRARLTGSSSQNRQERSGSGSWARWSTIRRTVLRDTIVMLAPRAA